MWMSALAGLVFANVAGAAAKPLNLGLMWNSISGAIGGGAFGLAFGAFSTAPVLLSKLAIGGIGGFVIMAILGVIRNRSAK